MPEKSINFLDLDRTDWENLFRDLGEQRFRADQLLQWLHRYRVDDVAAMTNLGKSLRERLDALGSVLPPQIVTQQVSGDGTSKWILQLADGNRIETVFIPEADRGTLCVSSQVGCQLNCSFCATAQQGFNRNLSTSEIIGQVWLAERLLAQAPNAGPAITNVVLMGMGEPLLNFENVVKAIRLMLDDHAYGLSRRRVTLSTAGVTPGIDRLRDAAPVSLAVSLHAPDDELRTRLVPLNRKYPIAELLAACKRYIAPEKNRKVTFEYAMLDGVNDSEKHARALVRLLAQVPSKINLIPFNPFPGTLYRRSPEQVISRFQDILHKHGLIVTVRRTRGGDIAAACGQLVGQVLRRLTPRERSLAGATL